MKQAAIITGSEGGIGQALCSVFREAGYKVIGLDISSDSNNCDEYVKADLGEICVSSQYRSKITEKIRALIREDKLVALVNNAAVQIIKPMEHINVGDWDNSLNVNVVAPFVLTQALLSDLEEGEGSVVNVASIHATLTKPGFICYATSKAALVGLTKSMAIELGPRVRVNAICPAAVATPMLLAGFEGKKKELDTLSNMHPLGRIADSHEVAKSALFLVSDSASFISGATLEVCGGISARLHDPL